MCAQHDKLLLISPSKYQIVNPKHVLNHIVNRRIFIVTSSYLHFAYIICYDLDPAILTGALMGSCTHTSNIEQATRRKKGQGKDVIVGVPYQ